MWKSIKRVLKIVGLVVGVLVLSLVVLVAVTFLGRRPIVDGFEAGGVRVIKDGITSLALVPIGEGAVALIDAGNDRAGKAVLAELARRGLGPAAVKAILLTHGHPDHIAAAHLFPGAAIMALAEDVPLAEGRSGGHGPLQRLLPVRPTGIKVSRALKDGETVTLGRLAVRVFAVPGHTAGSAAYLVSGVLFLGDSADAAKDGRLTGAPWLFSESRAQNQASLVALARRLEQEHAPVKALVFSHSGALDQGLAPLTAFAAGH